MCEKFVPQFPTALSEVLARLFVVEVADPDELGSFALCDWWADKMADPKPGDDTTPDWPRFERALGCAGAICFAHRLHSVLSAPEC